VESKQQEDTLSQITNEQEDKLNVDEDSLDRIFGANFDDDSFASLDSTTIVSHYSTRSRSRSQSSNLINTVTSTNKAPTDLSGDAAVSKPRQRRIDKIKMKRKQQENENEKKNRLECEYSFCERNLHIFRRK
jgi:hypothetical protein